MRRIAIIFCLLSCLSAMQARANPANCDGDMTPDQAEYLEFVVSLHPILFGGPIAILKSCERVKRFLTSLSNMGVSRRSTSVSDQQVSSALESMGGGSGSVSSCLRNFDASACGRFLGIGDSAVETPAAPAAPARAPLTLAQARAKRDELLLKDRELAANLLPICKSATSAQVCEGRLLAIESLRDDVARWNKDPELMAFIPAITLDSPDLIAQTGWERALGGGGWINRAGNRAEREVCPELTQLINGLVANAPERARERIPEFRSNCADRDPAYAAWLLRWDTQLAAAAAAKAGAKGGAYVRPEDCERLSRQIDADLRSRPAEAPPSLAFFEAECAGDTRYMGQLAGWKQALAAQKSADALNQWDSGVRQAEAEQKQAEAQRLAAQRSAVEDRQPVTAEATAKASGAAPQPAKGSAAQSAAAWAAGAGPQVICPAERASYIQAFADRGEPEGVADSPYFVGKAALASINLGVMAGKDNVTPTLAFEREQIEDAQKGLANIKNPKYDDPNFYKLRIARSRYRVCLIETLRRYNTGGAIDLQALTGTGSQPAAQQSSGTESARQPASAGASAAACEAAIQKSDREYEALNARPIQGALANLQRVMWMTKDRKAIVDANCPSSGKYATMRQELQQAYDSAAAGCRQLKAGGGECTPERN